MCMQDKDSDDEDSAQEGEEDEEPSTSGASPRAMQLDTPQTNFAERAKYVPASSVHRWCTHT